MSSLGDPNVIPSGLCFPWAWQDVQDRGGLLVHGTIREPFKEPANRYWHAWSERDGIVRDWQCMKMGYGGRWRAKGYPVDVFYELYEPEHVVKYDADLASIRWLKTGLMPKHRHSVEGAPKTSRRR